METKHIFFRHLWFYWLLERWSSTEFCWVCPPHIFLVSSSLLHSCWERLESLNKLSSLQLLDILFAVLIYPFSSPALLFSHNSDWSHIHRISPSSFHPSILFRLNFQILLLSRLCLRTKYHHFLLKEVYL